MRRAIAIFLALFLTGCASAAYKVASRENSYDFLEARYEESCSVQAPQPVPAWCPGAYGKLLAFKKHLEEANAAVQKGGALPLQMEQIKADEKGLKQMVKPDGGS